MAGFQLLLGENSKLKEMIPGEVGGNAEGHAWEEEVYRRTVSRRELVYGFAQPLCPNSKCQQTQEELIASPLKYEAPWWDSLDIRSTPTSSTKSSQIILIYQ